MGKVSTSKKRSPPKMTTNQASLPSYRMNDKDTSDFKKWSPVELAEFLKKASLGDYAEAFINHKISGRLASQLTDQDLKDMGIHIVGDRLRLKIIIQSLGMQARYDNRVKVWWEGTENLYFSHGQKMCYTCAGCCPDDPSTYKLTSSHLKVKTVDPQRCGPIKLCCCYEYHTNNIDLSKIHDVDVYGEPPPCLLQICCCATGKDHIEIQTPSEKEGTLSLVVQKGEGDRVSGMILHQIEEAQTIERD